MTAPARTSAFTLVELIMVIVIIGLLAAVVTPQFVDLRGDATQASEIATASRVRSGIKLLRLGNLAAGQSPFPDKLDDAGKGAAAEDNPLFAKVIERGVTDPRWEKIAARQYRYTPTGHKYRYDPDTGRFARTDSPGGTAGSSGGDPAVLFSDSLRDGQSDHWNVTRGRFAWGETGMSNDRGGENRAFLDVPVDSASYQVDLAANLEKGKGWGLWFGAGLDERNRVSGYTFQYDPGYGRGAYLLREWSNDRESVLMPVYADLDTGNFHEFTFDVSEGNFTAYQDGNAVLSYEGDLTPAGDLVGLRTWSNTEVEFRDFTVSTPSDKD